MLLGAEFLWDFCLRLCFFFAAGGGDPAAAKRRQCLWDASINGRAFCRAVGTSSFYSGESTLVVLRDPAVLKLKAMLAHQCERVASRLLRARSGIREFWQ